MNKQRETPIPEYKKKLVDELQSLVTSKKTILYTSIKNLPGSQFQQISKKIRDKAILKVPKKNLFFRAIDASKVEDLKPLKEHFTENVAVLFSDIDAFDLAAEILKNKSPAKAKAGQEAPEDIRIEAGPTDLPPGPAISELGAVGLQVQIKDGKIEIREPRVIVKQGEAISAEAADVMAKLDIKPFSIGLIPLSAYDNKEKKLYLEININTEETVANLKEFHRKSLAFAVDLGYANSDTITYLLGKAGMHEKALVKLTESEPAEEVQSDDKTEEKEEEPKQEENAPTENEAEQAPASEEEKTGAEEGK